VRDPGSLLMLGRVRYGAFRNQIPSKGSGGEGAKR
jgi:hypothetical protein